MMKECFLESWKKYKKVNKEEKRFNIVVVILLYLLSVIFLGFNCKLWDCYEIELKDIFVMYSYVNSWEGRE